MVVHGDEHESLAETGMMPQVGEMWLFDHNNKLFSTKRVYVLLEYMGWDSSDIVFNAFSLKDQKITKVYFSTTTNIYWKLLA